MEFCFLKFSLRLVFSNLLLTRAELSPLSIAFAEDGWGVALLKRVKKSLFSSFDDDVDLACIFGSLKGVEAKGRNDLEFTGEYHAKVLSQKRKCAVARKTERCLRAVVNDFILFGFSGITTQRDVFKIVFCGQPSFVWIS